MLNSRNKINMNCFYWVETHLATFIIIIIVRFSVNVFSVCALWRFDFFRGIFYIHQQIIVITTFNVVVNLLSWKFIGFIKMSPCDLSFNPKLIPISCIRHRANIVAEWLKRIFQYAKSRVANKIFSLEWRQISVAIRPWITKPT